MEDQGPRALNLSWMFRKKLTLGITEKPGAFHTSFHPEGWRYVGFHMFFGGIPPPDVNAGEDEFRREFARTLLCQDWVDMFVLVIMCDWYWLVMCAGKMTCSSSNLCVCVSVSVSCVDFCSIMYSLMFIVFGNNLKLKRFWTCQSCVFFHRTNWQVGKPEKIFPQLLSTDSVVLTQHLGNVDP